MPRSLDATDYALLEILQSEGRIAHRELARRLDMPPATVQDRVRKLSERGVIDSYVARVSPRAVGLKTVGLVSVTLASHVPEVHKAFHKHIRALPEVLECYLVSGGSDYELKVVVEDLSDYEDFLIKRLNQIEGISRIQTAFVLKTVKDETRLPLPPLEDE